MTSISRLIAGTAVVLAAVLAAAPVTAGVADQLINPGQQPTKRVSSQTTTGQPMAAGGVLADAAAEASGSLEEAAALVAETATDAETRVSALARDLQVGVDAGEFSQTDAERVLSDISSYIRGERTWPERSVA
ncbi:hypothetical protein [Brevibacterium renqingii]|uniref:hypothetical protein n=1 Tax=Brevibacterium renqingii TaxID=2776916 RepID=UPI001ADFA4E4|nr:hypothetical protein [Brevibacterium renqingii]